MSKDIVKHQTYSELIEQWKQMERDGVEFPVPLHEHFGIAGHTTKRKAFDLAKSRLTEHFDFTKGSKKPPGKGRRVLTLHLTVEALELFCLAAHTPQGDEIRQLYRQAKARWDKVQELAPSFAQEVEILTLKAEIAKQEAIARQSEEKTLQLRHYVTTALPETAQQKILGYQEVVRVEEREVHITPEGDRSDGFGITAIAKRYGFKSTKKAWQWLEAIGLGKDSPKWSSETRGVTSRVLPMDYLSDLDAAWVEGDGRDRFLGE